MRVLLTGIAVLVILSSFYEKKKARPKLPEGYVSIPAGTLSLDSESKFSINGFYMSKYEVSNLQYRQFVNESASPVKETLTPDASGWGQIEGSGITPDGVYFGNPAFDQYPVVNISYESAVSYCEWLQQKFQLDNPDFKIKVRLPSHAEWIWAARGGRSQAMFPWANYYLRNKKKEPMCNFRQVADFDIHRNRNTGQPEVVIHNRLPTNSFPTTPVKSFYPNDYGLYNMCGNAAEIIVEKGICIGGSWNDFGGDVHIRAQGNYERSAATIGFRPVIEVKGGNE